MSAPGSALDEVADGFVRLGSSPSGPPWADVVAVYVGGTLSEELTAEEASRRPSWSLCPPSASQYAMRECPVSPFRALDLLVQDGGRIVYEHQVPETVGCDTTPALPAWQSFRSITIRPDPAHRDCFGDFAITLYVDDEQRVSAVSLTLSSP